MKRTGTASAAASKRARADQTPRRQAVMKVVEASSLKEEELSLLKSVAPVALGSNKEDRHPIQHQVVDWVSKTLEGTLESRKNALREACAAADQAEKNMVELNKQKETAEKELEDLVKVHATATTEAKLAQDKKVASTADHKEPLSVYKKQDAVCGQARKVLKEATDLCDDFCSLVAGAESKVKPILARVIRQLRDGDGSGALAATLESVFASPVEQYTEFQSSAIREASHLLQRKADAAAAELATACKALEVCDTALSALRECEKSAAAADEAEVQASAAVDRSAVAVKTFTAEIKAAQKAVEKAKSVSELCEKIVAEAEAAGTTFEALKEQTQKGLVSDESLGSAPRLPQAEPVPV
eukprot:CAMPEP_0204253168 /NCGR_PEP_ID=MMETSP0468-20130131/1713_1 /ASSEMBLY_ACC=CAM_ASM_000383 /TAXON_ID=2969 /ORGANISM="Oxyrrhis marina" /LENGTH=357 /DNA_ID=CAMNT_0051226709 /DNA_START=42 /DNA_END=1115 /DNA_ORIENTATION=+